MIINIFTGKDIKDNNLPVSPDDVEFVTLGQYEALEYNHIWLIKHALELGYIGRAKASELLFIPLIDLDVILEKYEKT